MKKKIIFIVLLSFFGLLSCKSDQDTPKKETLQQKSEKMGAEAAKSIKEPLEKARNVADQETNRMRNMEKEVEKSAD